MTPNVGTADRVIRALIGIVLLYLALFSGVPFFDHGIVKFLAILVGIVMLVVAALRVCPLYSIFGVKTCSR